MDGSCVTGCKAALNLPLCCLYFQMSPFNNADKIKRPILLVRVKVGCKS